jgi:hypothetical protein
MNDRAVASYGKCSGPGAYAEIAASLNPGRRIVRPTSSRRVASGAPEATRKDHFFIFKSEPLKVLTIATISPSCVS